MSVHMVTSGSHLSLCTISSPVICMFRSAGTGSSCCLIYQAMFLSIYLQAARTRPQALLLCRAVKEVHSCLACITQKD